VAGASQLQRVRNFIELAEHDGIRIAARGSIDTAPTTGFCLHAVLLRDVPPGHKVAQEEIFGPVLSVMPFDTGENAIRMANNPRYGPFRSRMDGRRGEAIASGAQTRLGPRQHFPSIERVQNLVAVRLWSWCIGPVYVTQ
jgi:Aldehyde dehydrogenase family